MPALGPFELIDDVAPLAHDLHRALAAADPTGRLGADALHARAEIRLKHVLAALEQADVHLGAYDLAVARVLSGAPVETLVTILDWLARASAAGNAPLLAEAADHIKPCPPPSGPDGRCRHGDWWSCQRTDLAYRLRGLDPAQARRGAAARRR